MTRTARRIAFPLALAARRLRWRSGTAALVALGVAAAAAGLAALLGGSLVAEDRALVRALERLPEAQRGLHVAYFGVPPQGGGFAGLDGAVRRAVQPLDGDGLVRVVQYRQVRIGGRPVLLAGIDGARRWVKVRSGRLPRPCSPRGCEVLQAGGSGTWNRAASPRLVRVGRGALTSALPFGRLAPARATPFGATSYFAPEMPPPFLLAEGVAGVSALPPLESIYRAYVWIIPLEPGALRPWDIDGYAATVAHVRSELEARSNLFDVTAPVDELRASAATGRTTRQRLLLVGGEAAALLLAFAVLAAAGARRETEAAWQRLTRAGARRWQLALSTIAETALVTLPATAAGWTLGTAATLALASGAGSPAGAVARHSVLGGAGFGVAAGLAAATTGVLVLTLRGRALRLDGTRVSALDLAAVGAVGAIALALARGDVTAPALAAESGTAVFLLLLPALIAFAAAVAWMRALAPAVRVLERVSRGASLAARLGALSLARRPGRAASAVAFLVVSVAVALFASLYRSTLARGQAEQAAYAFPADFIVREDLDVSKLVRPLDAAPLSRYRALGRDLGVHPIIRRRGSVSRLGGAQLTLLGVPADALPALRGWRDDFAQIPLREVARRLSESGATTLRGEPLPPAASELLLPLRARGDAVAVTASVLTRRGDFVHLQLGETRGHLLRAHLPRAARGGRLVTLTLGLTRASQETGGPDEGTLVLRPARVRLADGRSAVVSDYRGWIGVNGVRVTRTPEGVRLRYVVTNQVESRFRPRQDDEGRPLPIAVTPRLAAAAGTDGVLPVQLAGRQLVGRVVATVRRFPTAYGDVVLADERRLFTRLNTDSPGSALPNEIWISAHSRTRAAAIGRELRRPPFDVLEVRPRATLEAELRDDPLARGSLVTLAAAATAALGLALVGLLLLVAADLRDERGELLDLEAEGAPPARLRRHLRLRAAIVAVFGVAGGLAAGALLAATVVDLVAVTANAAVPEPPLRIAADWPALSIGFVVYAAAAALVVAAATARAFGADTPRRAPETDE